MAEMILSILVPTTQRRIVQRDTLLAKLFAQAHKKPVEILSLIDNRTRTIGAKRQALVDIARGDYLIFCDDDDDISEDYVEMLLAAAEGQPDVITFEQVAKWNGDESRVIFQLGQEDGNFNPGGVTMRAPWHVCAWRRTLVADCVFPHTNWGEDRNWSAQARRMATREAHIKKVLHFYTHTDEHSLAIDTPAGS